jgi:exopolysaccharide production protein ExoY
MATDDTVASAGAALVRRTSVERNLESRGFSSADDMVCRGLDIVLALGLILFLAPLMLLAAIACWAQDGGPPVFVQQRVGRDGRMFRCFKFRSMVIDAEQRLHDLLNRDPKALAEWTASQKLAKDPRITAWGQFIRKSSVDELPQLFNVLRGEMSLVGPRPIVSAEMVRYGHYLPDYKLVRPGITGLWQISGRSTTSYRQRVAMDVIFARRRTATLYLKILLGTVPAVLLRDGAC